MAERVPVDGSVGEQLEANGNGDGSASAAEAPAAQQPQAGDGL